MKEKAMSKPNIVELQYVRAFAILAVLMIHVTATASVTVNPGQLAYPIYQMANQLSMFAVPLFIMISGIVLFYRYYDTWDKTQILSFYRKRLQFIVIPFLLWSIFYYLFNQLVSQHRIDIDFASFFELARWGRTSYHLYYMVIIIQFYAVFPLLMTLLHKLRMGVVSVVVIGLTIQAAIYSIHHWIKPIAHLPTLLPNYMLVFCVGGAIGILYKRFANHAGQLWWVFATAVATGFLYMFLLINAKSGAHYWAPLYVILYNLYAVLVGISLVWMSMKFTSGASWLSKRLYAIGACSFGIYLVHPAVLTVWRHLYNPTVGQPGYHLYNLLSLVVVIVVPWLIVRVMTQWKFTWVLFGKMGEGRDKQKTFSGKGLSA